MTHKSYTLTVGVIFFVVAILHLLRIVFQWDAMVGGWLVPQWVSWVAVILLLTLVMRDFSSAEAGKKNIGQCSRRRLIRMWPILSSSYDSFSAISF